MKKLFVIGVFFMGLPAFADVCNKATAETHAAEVAATIQKVNGLKSQVQVKVTEDQNFYFFEHIFDTGLDVPAYKVQIEKYNCQIRSVSYANYEG
ncbi:hypothetical protein K2X30_05540 [bacterium]|nr:hypothetical protein [bacterium]